jgi:hypothetical protein
LHKPLPPKAPHFKSHSRTTKAQRTSLSYTCRASQGQPSLYKYNTHFSSSSLIDSWGDTLEPINTWDTFRVLLQNPNGLQLRRSVPLLRQDAQVCHDYGAAVIALPETNVNWSCPSQHHILSSSIKQIWPASTYQTSRASEVFVSTYQPGGTATIICSHRTSRVIQKGEDPWGLGRWSFITLKGKENSKITIVTAYSPGYSTVEKATWRQQERLLSKAFCEHNLPLDFTPHRQMVLDLQAWLQHLIAGEHQLILCIDANETYHPDTTSSVHPLLYSAPKPTRDCSHNGKLATLLSTCHLIDPLALHHPERPFPASHIRGKNRIDYFFVSATIRHSLLRSGSLPYYSLLHGDHRPYFLDLNSKLLFSDPTVEISRPIYRTLRLLDPRLSDKYREALHAELSLHRVFEKCEELRKFSIQGTRSAHHEAIYHQLDDTITKSMLSAERSIKKGFPGSLPGLLNSRWQCRPIGSGV